jgi:hypothetical protein
MKRVEIARKDRWRVQTNAVYYFATFDFGQATLIARLFDTPKARAWFLDRTTSTPVTLGRVRFK